MKKYIFNEPRGLKPSNLHSYFSQNKDFYQKYFLGFFQVLHSFLSSFSPFSRIHQEIMKVISISIFFRTHHWDGRLFLQTFWIFKTQFFRVPYVAPSQRVSCICVSSHALKSYMLIAMVTEEAPCFRKFDTCENGKYGHGAAR